MKVRQCSVCREPGHNRWRHKSDTRRGIVCPQCAASDSRQRVLDSRLVSAIPGQRRRRVCGNCGARYTTIERIEASRDDYNEALSALDLAVTHVKRVLGRQP